MGLQEGGWPQSFITPKSFIYSARFSERVLSLETLREEIGDSTVLFGGEVSGGGYKQFQRWDHCVCPVPKQSKPETRHPQDGSIESDSGSWGVCPTEVESQTLAYNKGKPAIMGCLRSGGDLISFWAFLSLAQVFNTKSFHSSSSAPPPTEQWREGFSWKDLLNR